MEFVNAHLLNKPEIDRLKNWNEKIGAMYQQQLSNWKMASNHYRQFKSIEKRIISKNALNFVVQFNPARARSTCADLSKKTIENRRCFLCAHHLPEDQKGFTILDKYLLLVNPFPIFQQHLTISDFQHIPQKIEGRIPDLLEISKLLEGFTVFYNGPKCGASAPDHFHFQAARSGFMPVENDMHNKSLIKTLHTTDDLTVYELENYLRKTIVLKSESINAINTMFQKIYRQLPFDKESDEPRMNLISIFENGQYHLIIFPRKDQRPQCYFKEDELRILISPASVEMAGVLVTPNKENFQNLKFSDLEEIFADVSLNQFNLQF